MATFRRMLNFPTGDAGTSKAEETEFFRQIFTLGHNGTAQGSYAAGFFNPELLGWIERKIEADAPADIWQWTQAAWEAESRAITEARGLGATVSRKTEELIEKDKVIADLRAKLAEAERARQEADERARSAEHKLWLAEQAIAAAAKTEERLQDFRNALAMQVHRVIEHWEG